MLGCILIESDSFIVIRFNPIDRDDLHKIWELSDNPSESPPRNFLTIPDQPAQTTLNDPEPDQPHRI